MKKKSCKCKCPTQRKDRFSDDRERMEKSYDKCVDNCRKKNIIHY